MATETLYKLLGPGGACHHGGSGTWPLPPAAGPGAWLPVITGPLVACEHGYHLVRFAALLRWPGRALYVAEGRGDHRALPDKSVWRQARLLRRVAGWNERNLRLFAADCAEHVGPRGTQEQDR